MTKRSGSAFWVLGFGSALAVSLATAEPARAGGGEPPMCGTGLYCKGSPFSGASACRQPREGKPVVHCCPSGQRIVNGACAPKPPTCGTGLYCTGNDAPIAGSSPCTQPRADENIVNCCPKGQKIDGGKCSGATSDGRRAKIAQLYRDILGREAEPAGLDGWTSSPQSLAEVRMGIAKAAESQAKLNGLYKKWLCRDAEPSGLAHWTNLLGTEHTFAKVSEMIAAAPEAQQKKSGGWYKNGVCVGKP